MPEDGEERKEKVQEEKPRIIQCPPGYAWGAEGGPTVKPKTRTKQKRE
jgi:hypothetical protein